MFYSHCVKLWTGMIGHFSLFDYVCAGDKKRNKNPHPAFVSEDNAF